MKTLATTFMLAALTASTVSAQRPTGFFVEAMAGGSVATQDLGRTGILDDNSYVGLESTGWTPRLAVAVGRGVAGSVAVRARGTYDFEVPVRSQWFCDGFTPCPASLVPVSARVGRWSLGGDIQWSPGSARRAFRPFASLGAGVRRTSVAWGSVVAGFTPSSGYDHDAFYWRPALGLAHDAGGMTLLAEVDATMQSFGAERPQFIEGVTPEDTLGPPERQMDLGISVGLRIPLGR